MYRVVKVLNNNGILVLDGESRKEIILLGNGVGFGRKTGERLELPKDAKQYELMAESTTALKQVNSIEPVFIEAAGRIIEIAEREMGEISHDILIPMADHIALAVKRAKEGREFPNPFEQDIKALFSEEYRVALGGREVIEDMAGIVISDGEVGFITLHIHAGLSEENVADAMEMARLVKISVHQIQEEMGLHLASDSLGYNRLVSHIRYMIARTRKGERANLDLDAYAKENFPRPYELARRICSVMEKQLNMSIAQEEIGFLAIHIQRVTKP